MHKYISKTTRYLTNCLRRSQRDAKLELVEDKVKEFEPINTNIKELELPNINGENTLPTDNIVNDFELQQVNNNDF